MPIALLADLKTYVGIDAGDTDDDGLLTSILTGVSQRVENYTGRKFTPDPPLDNTGHDTLPPVTKTVNLRTRSGAWWLPPPAFPPPRTVQIPIAREIDTVTVQGGTITGYQAVGDAPWRRLQLFGLSLNPPPLTAIPAVQITGRFGYWPTPDDLKDAVLIMASRRYKERDAGYADAVMLQDGATVSYFKQFPPTVQATLDFYARKVGLP